MQTIDKCEHCAMLALALADEQEARQAAMSALRATSRALEQERALRKCDNVIIGRLSAELHSIIDENRRLRIDVEIERAVNDFAFHIADMMAEEALAQMDEVERLTAQVRQSNSAFWGAYNEIERLKRKLADAKGQLPPRWHHSIIDVIRHVAQEPAEQACWSNQAQEILEGLGEL